MLPSDFELEQYGIRVRLVKEEDAAIIVKMRTDPQNVNFLGKTDSDVEKQVEWIRDYKKREAEARDYYFICSKDNEPIVVSRIYNIDWTHLTYTSGSWVSVPGTDYEDVMKCSIILGEIAQDRLGLLLDIFEVRKGNKQVLNFHRKITCSMQYGETELDYLFICTPETRKNSKLKKLLGL